MEKLHLLKIFSFNASSPNYLPIHPPTYLPNQQPIYLYSLFVFYNTPPPLSSNSTPFNPQSGPREAQWKPYDLPLLFLTPPLSEWPYLVNPRPFSTYAPPAAAYLLLSRVDGERPVGLHPRPLAGVLLPVRDEAEGDGGDERVAGPSAEHLHLPFPRVAQPGEKKMLLFPLTTS